MAKKYIINGVQVKYDVFNKAMNNPDDFSNPDNIDASDIPQFHKDAYAHDRWNESMGRGQTFWTPRRRMLNSLERKNRQVKKKKELRLKIREAKMQALGKQRWYTEELSGRAELVNSILANQAQQQENEDKKSTLLFLVVFVLAFVAVCLILSLGNSFDSVSLMVATM